MTTMNTTSTIQPVAWALEVLSAHFEQRRPKISSSSYLNKPLACFVTLFKGQHIRGASGSNRPKHRTLWEEIAANTLAAAFHDRRFAPLHETECKDLQIQIQVLNEPERITTIDELNPKTHGIIVKEEEKEGILLPNLPEINTPELQLDLACRKAGIYGFPKELFRFTVICYD